MSLRQGFLRLGTGLGLLWLVFWTCAYVIRPQSSENMPFPPALSLTTEIALVTVAILGAPWIVLGFKPN